MWVISEEKKGINHLKIESQIGSQRTVKILSLNWWLLQTSQLQFSDVLIFLLPQVSSIEYTLSDVKVSRLVEWEFKWTERFYLPSSDMECDVGGDDCTRISNNTKKLENKLIPAKCIMNHRSLTISESNITNLLSTVETRTKGKHLSSI